LADAIAKAFREKRSQYEHPVDVLFIHTQQGHEFAISVTPPWPLAGIQRELLEVFCSRIAAAFDNLYLFGQLRKAQEATVVALADLAEFRDEGTGGHVKRVQMLTEAIARKLKERGVYDDELTPQLMEMIGWRVSCMMSARYRRRTISCSSPACTRRKSAPSCKCMPASAKPY
jgi:hypothetical protein